MKDRTLLGVYSELYNQLLGINLPTTEIWQYPGFEKHVAKKHKNCLCYIDKIKEIINNPDYISVNSKIPNSIEFIKRYSDIILLSVNLDMNNGYLYVSSLYNIEEAKLDRKRHSGKLCQLFDKCEL